MGKDVADVIPIRLPKEVTSAVAAWGKRHGIRARSAALRCLIEIGLASGLPPKKR